MDRDGLAYFLIHFGVGDWALLPPAWQPMLPAVVVDAETLTGGKFKHEVIEDLEGRKFLHVERFADEKRAEDQARMPPGGNPHLPPDYVEKLRSSVSEKDAREYVEGRFDKPIAGQLVRRGFAHRWVGDAMTASDECLDCGLPQGAAIHSPSAQIPDNSPRMPDGRALPKWWGNDGRPMGPVLIADDDGEAEPLPPMRTRELDESAFPEVKHEPPAVPLRDALEAWNAEQDAKKQPPTQE